MLRNSRYLFCAMALLLSAILIAPGYAAKGGNGGGKPDGGGGEDPEPTPSPVVYSLHRFSLPFDYLGGIWNIEEVNDLGELVGHYGDANATGGEQPFYLDANAPIPNKNATNLNYLEYETGFTIPDGWYIDAANGINNLGDIACALAKDGDPEQLRGCVIELRPDSSVQPRLHLLPDGAWSHTYARRINDAGVVLGRGDSVTSYVYQMPLHGQTSDGIIHIIPDAFDAWDAHLSNPIEGGPSLVNAYLGSNEILTYNADTKALLPSTDISALGVSSIRDFNDWANFCGTYNIQKGKNKGRKGFVYDGDFHSLNAMQFSDGLNNSGDVVGLSADRRPVLDHPDHGTILIDDTILALDIDEQAIWDNSGAHYIPTLSERNTTGFPVVVGTMNRPDSSYSSFYDGYVLFPSLP